MKKQYIQPRVENTHVTMSAIVMVGSPTLPIDMTPIGGDGD